MKYALIMVCIFAMIYACGNIDNNLRKKDTSSVSLHDQTEAASTNFPYQKVEKTESEWQAQLGETAYRVLRKSGTEMAYTGKYWNNKESGIYTCGACNLPLFSSDTKFKSGTGWPSYYAPINPQFVGKKLDTSKGMNRVEVVCNRCNSHLGHVFKDGPKPTGLRYCINSAALNFESGNSTLPEDYRPQAVQ